MFFIVGMLLATPAQCACLMHVKTRDVAQCARNDLLLLLCAVGVNVRNMKMDFNTGGTWHRVG